MTNYGYKNDNFIVIIIEIMIKFLKYSNNEQRQYKHLNTNV